MTVEVRGESFDNAGFWGEAFRQDLVEWPHLNIIEEHHVRGRVDFLVHHPDGNVYPVELKTQNSRSFELQDDIDRIDVHPDGVRVTMRR